jgi:hypothetical protein
VRPAAPVVAAALSTERVRTVVPTDLGAVLLGHAVAVRGGLAWRTPSALSLRAQ